MQKKVASFKFLRLAVTLSCIFFSPYLLASPVIPINGQPQITTIAPTMPALDASSYILIDANSNKILAEKNADTRLAPASLTKLMTMYVISDALKNGSIRFDDKVRISTKAWQTGGSRMFVKVNDEVPVRDLLQGIVVASGNDASVAMAEYLAGSEDTFASLMNTQAKNLGMKNTHFVDSNGLPNPNHFSTARDLAILAQAIINNFPEDYKLYSEKWFTFNKIKQPNRNRLLWRFQYADGLKTGHTDAAGYCLVGSAIKNGTRLISVVMGAPNDSTRTEDSIRLLTYGFRFFETHKLYDANSKVTSARVWKGKLKEINLGVAKDYYLTMPAGQYKNIQVITQIGDLKAPLLKGKSYGTLRILLNGQTLATEPLVALTDNPKGGIFHNFADSIHYGFHKLFSRSNEKANNG